MLIFERTYPDTGIGKRVNMPLLPETAIKQFILELEMGFNINSADLVLVSQNNE